MHSILSVTPSPRLLRKQMQEPGSNLSQKRDFQPTFVPNVPNVTTHNTFTKALDRQATPGDISPSNNSTRLSSMGPSQITASNLFTSAQRDVVAALPGVPGLSRTDSSFASLLWLVAASPP